MIRTLATLLAAAAFGPAAAIAQMGWTLEAAAGGAVHDPLAAHVGSTAASLGLSYDGATRWGYAAAGVPISGDGPAWGSAGASAWLARPHGVVEIGVLLGADAFGYGGSEQPHGFGASARVLPGVVATRGAWRAELYAGGAGQTATQSDSTARRAVAEADARLAWGGADGLVLGAGLRYLHGAEGGYPFAGVTAALDHQAVSLWGEAGAWLNDELPSPRAALAVGGDLRLGGRTSVGVAWRQEPSEPLFRNPPRRAWNVLLRRTLGGAAAATGRSGATAVRVSAGMATFRLPRSQHPQAPALISDLTGWQPVALRLVGEDWTLTLPAGRGLHRYTFRTPQGGIWLPPAEPREPDGFGGFNAVLVVP